MLLHPRFNHSQIGIDFREPSFCSQHRLFDFRASVIIQRRHMVPPDALIPGKCLIHRSHAAPVVAHQHKATVIQCIFVQKILYIVQRIVIIKVHGHSICLSALIPVQDICIQTEDDPLRHLMPEHHIHGSIKLAEIAIRQSDPYRRSAHRLFDPAGTVIRRHRSSHQYGIRIRLLCKTYHLATFAEKYRLPLCRHSIIAEWIYSIHDAAAQHKQQQDPCQQSAGPALICIFHVRASF